MPMMTIFEPLFILLFLATVVTLVAAVTLGLRGQRQRAGSILRRLAICAAVYFATRPVSSQDLPIGRRSITSAIGSALTIGALPVVDAKRTATSSGVSWAVTLRLGSRARRVAQRENDATVYLTDDRGRRFDPVPDAAMVPLDVRLEPGQSVDVTRRFELPSDAQHAGLIFTHEGGFPIGSFIIGENQWFHGPAIVTLE